MSGSQDLLAPGYKQDAEKRQPITRRRGRACCVIIGHSAHDDAACMIADVHLCELTMPVVDSTRCGQIMQHGVAACILPSSRNFVIGTRDNTRHVTCPSPSAVAANVDLHQHGCSALTTHDLMTHSYQISLLTILAHAFPDASLPA